MPCPTCNFTDPSGYADISTGCPECGTPYTDQPNPLHSEMEMRNMPAPGEEDQGGNPLKEGILADNGWQNGGTSQGTGRDESFASVRASQDNIIERQEAVIPWHMAADFEIEQVVEPGPHTVEVDAPGQPIILQHDNPDILDAARAQLTAKNAGLIQTLFQVGGGAAGGALGTLVGPEGTVAGAMLGRAAGGLMGNLVGGKVEDSMGGGGGQQGQMGQSAAPVQPYRSLEQLSHIVNGADFSSPSSVDSIPSNDTSDPEQVDPHEKNDGDNDTWQKDFSVNEVGGTQHPFPEDSGGLEALQLLLPLVLHHHENGTGADDPLMHALDKMLDADAPGYKDGDPDHEAIQVLLGIGKGDPTDQGPGHDPLVKDEAGDDGGDDDLDGNDIEKESAFPGSTMGPASPQEQAMQSVNWPQSDVEQCPHCGAHTKMHLGICPMCGEEVQPFQHVASGPRTPEQFKAVADLLRSKGRDKEIQNLIDMPDQYESELAEVQQRQEVTPAEGPEPPMQQMPAQEETPPGAGMPMPAPPTGIQQMGSIVQGADSLAPKCPKCDSHTTGLVDNEGKARCHACGNTFDSGAEGADGESTHNTTTASWHVLGEDQNHHDHTNTIAVPAADQERPDDPTGHQDSSLSWQDESGQPLKVGQEYKMYSERYDIPDLIRIEAVKPDGISYTITGEYGFDHAVEISREDANLYHYTFVPSDGHDDAVNNVNDPGIEENNDYAGQADPGQQTDLADSSQMVASFERGVIRRAAQPAEGGVPKDGVDHGDPSLEWLRGDERTAGANFTLSEQRNLIDERGTARNADKLDLSHTHYESGYREADEDDFLFGL